MQKPLYSNKSEEKWKSFSKKKNISDFKQNNMNMMNIEQILHEPQNINGILFYMNHLHHIFDGTMNSWNITGSSIYMSYTNQHQCMRNQWNVFGMQINYSIETLDAQINVNFCKNELELYMNWIYDIFFIQIII